MSERKNLTNGSFKGVVFHMAIPTAERGHGISSREITTERRLQLAKRPLADGARVRDFGAEARTFAAEIHFFGPNYQLDFEAFEAILTEGSPGTLVLPDYPKAVLAYFWKMTDQAGVEDGKVVRVSWVENSENPSGNEIQGAAGLGSGGLVPSEAKAKLDAEITSTKSLLQDNVFLKGVRAFESGLSFTRSLVNTVLTLEDGVRNRIIQVQANITGTIDLVKDGIEAISRIRNDLFPKRSNPSRQELGTDSETGQKIADFSSPASLPAPADPLAKPEVAPAIASQPRNLESDPGIELFARKLIDSLKADRDHLLADTQGRADDVASGLTRVANSLQAFVESIRVADKRHVIVPTEMSLMEVMFLNGVGLERLEAIHAKNLDLSDLLIIPAGSVVTL